MNNLPPGEYFFIRLNKSCMCTCVLRVFVLFLRSETDLGILVTEILMKSWKNVVTSI